MPDARQETPIRLSRRAFLQGSTLLLACGELCPERLLAAVEDRPKLRLGLLTDLHYADKESKGTRYYRETLQKLAEAGERFDQEKPDLVIALGDLVDAAPLDEEKQYLARIVSEFARLPGKHHFVLGNHCVEVLTKPEYLAIVGQEKTYYSFDAAGYHFVILDACFRSDGEPYARRNFKWTDANIPRAEIDWLRADLRQTPYKTLVFIHQPLDMVPPHGVTNGPDVRKILEESGKVLGVLQGHYHKGGYQELAGIHYCTLSAVIEGTGPENNAYALLDILPDDSLRLTGFRRQNSYRW
jgi:alkaline phosphatase